MSDYEKLTPSSETRGDGEFVKRLQGQFGTGVQGGTHVHKDWWAKHCPMMMSCRKSRRTLTTARTL